MAFAVLIYTVVVLVVLASRIAETGLTPEDFYFIPALTGTAVGVYLTLRVPENRMGMLMTVMSVALVTLGLTNALISWALEQGNDGLTVASVHLSDLAWLAQFLTALVFLPLWFPTGRPITPRWAWVGRLAIIAAAIAQVSFFLSESVCAYETSISDVCVTVPSPLGIEGFAGFEVLFLLSMGMALPAVASAFVRWRRSDDIERHQIKWFIVAAVGLVIAFIVSFAEFDQVISEFAFATGLTGVWAAIAVAVLKYRLFDIDRIISRTVSYALIIAVLAAVYIGLVTAIGSQFESSLAVAASTLAVAALFNPLRRRVQRWVDRHFNRSTYDTRQVMDHFAGSLRDEVDTDEVIEGWVDVVEATMQPSSVGVWVRL